ncbi:hypothetical protein Q3G72_003510 [Acer saccharum]|nr:hypothetical protein Q3G72_003510 [Acer saccharum]
MQGKKSKAWKLQCSPDITQSDCRICLSRRVSQIPDCCNGNMGGRVYGPSCNIRFEMYRFYTLASPPPTSPSPPENATPPSPPPASSTNSSGKHIILYLVFEGSGFCARPEKCALIFT